MFKAKFDQQLVEVDDLDYAIEEMRAHHAKSTMLETILDVGEMISDDEDPLVVLQRLQSSIAGLQLDVTGSSSESDLVADWRSVYDEVADRSARTAANGLAGIPTGFPTLDEITGGGQPGELWVIAARLGQGKTWTMIRMACAALFAGYRLQYDALEQARGQVAVRVHTFLSSKHGRQVFTAADLTQGRNIHLGRYRKFLRDLPDILGPNATIFINDTSRGRVNPTTIASQIERNSPAAVYIDYITLMGGTDAGGKASREQWQQVAALSAELKGLAMNYGIPIFVAAQINRTYTLGSQKRLPGVENLSGSDAIGHDADKVVTMRRATPSVMQMGLMKNRQGPDGVKWWNEFRVNTGAFNEITAERAEEIMDLDREDMDDLDD